MAAAAGGGGASVEDFPLTWGWDREYGLGKGINLITGKVASAVSPFEEMPLPTPAPVASLKTDSAVVKSASSYTDATCASFKLGGEYGWSAVSKVTASAAGSISNRMARTENAMHGVVNATFTCGESHLTAQELAALKLSDDAIALLQEGPEKFVAEYGHGVIIGFQRAAKVTGIVTVELHDKSSKRSAEASLKASLETIAFSGSAEAAASQEVEATASASSQRVAVECEGINSQRLKSVDTLPKLREWLADLQWSDSGTPVQATVCPWHRLGAVFRKAGLGAQLSQLPSGRPTGTGATLQQATRIALQANWVKLNTETDDPMNGEAVVLIEAAMDAMRSEAAVREALVTDSLAALQRRVDALRLRFEEGPMEQIFNGTFGLWNTASKYFLLTTSRSWQGEKAGFVGANPMVNEAPTSLVQHAMFERFVITWHPEAECHSLWAEHHGRFIGVNAKNQVVATREGRPFQFEAGWEAEKWQIRVVDEDRSDGCAVVAFRHMRTGRWLLLQPLAPGKQLCAVAMSAATDDPPPTDEARFALGQLTPSMHFRGTFSLWNPATKLFLKATHESIGAGPSVTKGPRDLAPTARFERFAIEWHHDLACHSIEACSLRRFLGADPDHTGRLETKPRSEFAKASDYVRWYIRILEPSSVDGCPLVALQNSKSRGWLRLDGYRGDGRAQKASMSARSVDPPPGDEYRFIIARVAPRPVRR